MKFYIMYKQNRIESRMPKETCACDEHGRCGLCIMKEMEYKPVRVPKKPNKAGICSCLSTPDGGFRYTAHELQNGKVVDVQRIQCENCKLTLVNLNQVKADKLEKLNIVETTRDPELVWVEWCSTQCKN